MVSLSVAVMAHPDRAEHVGLLVDRLGISDDQVAWDTDGVRWHTGRRAWELADPDADWHLVVQDDALVCADLVPAMAKALDHVPVDDAIVSLYVGRRRPAAQAVDNAVVAARARVASWIVMRGLNWGVAIAAPTWIIPGMLAWCDRQTVPQYDLRIGRYARDVLRWPVWCPFPSPVDHRADMVSLVGHPSGRVAHEFIGEDRSAFEIDWSAGAVEMEGMQRFHRLRARHGTIDRTRSGDVPMSDHDPFAPATARRVHVQRPPADEPASAVVGAGFIDPDPAPDERHDEYETVPADVPRGTPDVDEDTPSGDESAPDGPPRVNDSKAKWVEYARSQGGDPSGMTKAELVDQYG